MLTFGVVGYSELAHRRQPAQQQLNTDQTLRYKTGARVSNNLETSSLTLHANCIGGRV